VIVCPCEHTGETNPRAAGNPDHPTCSREVWPHLEFWATAGHRFAEIARLLSLVAQALLGNGFFGVGFKVASSGFQGWCHLPPLPTKAGNDGCGHSDKGEALARFRSREEKPSPASRRSANRVIVSHNGQGSSRYDGTVAAPGWLSSSTFVARIRVKKRQYVGFPRGGEALLVQKY